MKTVLKKIFIVMLSLVLTFTAVTGAALSVNSITAYASDDDDEAIYFYNTHGDVVKKFQNSAKFLLYIIGFVEAEMGVATSSDFTQYVANLDEMIEIGSQFKKAMTNNVYYHEDYTSTVSTDYITYEPDTEEITVSSELISMIKELLEEYAEENEQYTIHQTQDYSTLEPSNFANMYEYLTFRYLVRDSTDGVVGLFYNVSSSNSKRYFYIVDVPILTGDFSFVYYDTFSNCDAFFSYDDYEWSFYKFTGYYLPFSKDYLDTYYTTWNDVSNDVYSTDNTDGVFTHVFPIFFMTVLGFLRFLIVMVQH